MFEINSENLPYLYFSQFGEDKTIISYFEAKINGFYVDVGAHHPYRYSNTFASYLRGWCGVNIEPDPTMISHFKELRARDITLNIGIAKNRGKLPYYQFKSGEINTFDPEHALRLDRNLSYDTRIVSVTEIPTLPLRDVLKKYASEKMIDFLSVDTEGLDLEVIESSDWDLYRPTLVLVEDLGFETERYQDSKIYTLMRSKGYQLMAKTVATLIFEEESAYKKRISSHIL